MNLIVCDTLATIDDVLANKGKTLLLVSSLLKSYKKFVDALMYDKQTLSLDEVKLALNIRELQEKQRNLDHETSESLTLKGKYDPKKKEKEKKGSKKNSKTKTRLLNAFNCHKKRTC